MKILTSHTHPALGVFLSSCALILSGALSSAQSCPSDIEPPAASQEQLVACYQPHIYDPNDNTILRRLRYSPDPAIWGTGPYPTVLTIHGGEFSAENDHGSAYQAFADKDLSDAGFLVEYRLAPDGLILQQTSHDNTVLGIASGRPPQQSNDVKQEILAARADTAHCNGTIFLVGGSSGGTHALWAALDPNATVPGWSSASFPKAVVGLSGVYDLTLRTPPPPQQFINDVQNYTNTIDNFIGLEYQYSVSPLPLVGAATNGDPVPHYQSDEMFGALFGHANVREVTIHNSNLHAFNYWHKLEDNGTTCVSADVVSFLQAHLP